MTIRVVLAEPKGMFSEAVRSVLAQERDFEVARAESLDELLEVARDWEPTVALVDLDLPPRGGIDAVIALTGRYETRTIVWSSQSEAHTMSEAMRANASGYLPKEVDAATLVRSVREVSRGAMSVPALLRSALPHELQITGRRRRARERVAALSARELDVLALVAEGHGNRQIAGALYISEFTVKRHLHSILTKLGLESRRDAAAVYLEAQQTGDESAVRGRRTYQETNWFEEPRGRIR